LSNEKPLINEVLSRWLEPPQDLVPDLDCVACTLSTEDRAHAQRWRDFKCCAFQPFFANFLCGAMLEAGISPFVDSQRVSLQPLGLIPTRDFRDRCEKTPDALRDKTHLCAFYQRDTRQCSVWKFRPGECSFYFCKSNTRRETWSTRAFAVENGLAQMALAQQGFSPARIAEQVDFLNSPPLGLPSLTRAEAEEIYRAAWTFAKAQDALSVASWLRQG